MKTISAPPDRVLLGHVICGYRVIAAIAERDREGHLPHLHVVTATRGWGDATELVTWQVGWQPRHGWTAVAGHYFQGEGKTRDALADMLARWEG